MIDKQCDTRPGKVVWSGAVFQMQAGKTGKGEAWTEEGEKRKEVK